LYLYFYTQTKGNCKLNSQITIAKRGETITIVTTTMASRSDDDYDLLFKIVLIGKQIPLGSYNIYISHWCCLLTLQVTLVLVRLICYLVLLKTSTTWKASLQSVWSLLPRLSSSRISWLKRRFGILLDRRNTEQLLMHTTVVQLVLWHFTTSLDLNRSWVYKNGWMS